jgi:multisubunit Na+/H+ antiporter MnhB subunit
MAFAFDLALVLLTVAVAAWTIALRDGFAAVVAFVVYGALLALAWVRLGAIDVALTEAAIGAGLTGALLIGAAAAVRRATRTALPEQRPDLGTRTLAAVLCAAVAGSIAAGVLLLPEPAPSLAADAARHLDATGLGNPVTAVLIAYRATDTLLEKVVLVLAIAGVWSLAPDPAWGGRPGPAPAPVQPGALVLLARLLPPVGFVVGAYVLWAGADHPGGAFQGGTILAAMVLLVVMAGLADVPRIGSRALRAMVLAGPMVFLAVGFAGVVIADAFLAYPVPYAKPIILAIEIVLTLSIAATLALLLAGPPERDAAPARPGQ